MNKFSGMSPAAAARVARRLAEKQARNDRMAATEGATALAAGSPSPSSAPSSISAAEGERLRGVLERAFVRALARR